MEPHGVTGKAAGHRFAAASVPQVGGPQVRRAARPGRPGGAEPGPMGFAAGLRRAYISAGSTLADQQEF